MKSTGFHMKYTTYLAFSGRGVLGEIRRISHEIHPNEPRTNGPIFTFGLVFNISRFHFKLTV